MSIEKGTYYKIVCDECGEAFPEHDAGGFTLYDSVAEAASEAQSADGEIKPDGTILCAECAYANRPRTSMSDHGHEILPTLSSEPIEPRSVIIHCDACAASNLFDRKPAWWKCSNCGATQAGTLNDA